MSKFWSPIVHDLIPYTPGEQPKIPNLIKLNTNENPYPPTPLAIDAISKENGETLRLYPDPEASKLKNAIAARFKLDTNQIFIGNGSDEVLAHVFNALLKHDAPILFPDVTYSFYPTYAGLYNVDYRLVPLAEDFSINVDDYLGHGDTISAILFPNPNAPTGRLLGLSEIKRLLNGNRDHVVVIDEAYIDFGGETAVPLIHDYPNVLVVQTLSKSRALAGMRIGFAMGHPDLINALERIKNSFNSYPLDRLAQVAAVAAINDEEYFKTTCAKVIQTRETLIQQLEKLGFSVLPSAANFIFTTHPKHDAMKISQALRTKGIIVRHFSKERIDQYLRISIGTDAECAALLQELKNIV